MKFKTKILALAIAGAMPLQSMALEPAADFKDAITGGKVSGMLRLRYEGVHQDSKTKDASALTLRSSVGYETKPLNGFSLKTIVYNLAHLGEDDFNDTKNGKGIYPVVADPEDTDFHNLYLQWATKGHQLRFGRQNIFLDNWRMVGDVRFRQNWQVFDGFTYVNTMLPKTKIFYGYFDRYKHVNTRKHDIGAHFLNANYKVTKGTSVTGYAYLTEFKKNGAEQNSAKTFGLRVNGKEKINDTFSALYTAEYAKQTDYKDGRDADSKYYMLSGGVGIKGWDFRLNNEFLEGATNGSEFQPHFGTNHLFTGWADLFLNTPGQGIDDTFVSVVGKFMGAKIKAEYHMIDSDLSVNGDDEYGTEFDLGIYKKFRKNIIGSVEYAKFNQEDTSLGKGDIEKFWLTAIVKF